MSITRRRLLTGSGAGLAGGGAAAVLAACGSDREEPSTERDVELLEGLVDPEGAVLVLYKRAVDQSLEPEALAAVEAFEQATDDQLTQLVDAIRSAGGEAAEANGNGPAAENVLEALKIALTDAIAACHGAVGGLSTPELRRLVYELMTTDAAQLAVIRGLLGDEQAPEAFVTGGKEPPLAGKPEESNS